MVQQWGIRIEVNVNLSYDQVEKPQGGYSGRSMTCKVCLKKQWFVAGRYVGGAMGSNILVWKGEFVDGAQKRGGMQQNVGMGNTGGAGRIRWTL